MGRKRNSEDKEEKIRRKIRKLQEKLSQTKPKRFNRIIYSSSDENSGGESDASHTRSARQQSPPPPPGSQRSSLSPLRGSPPSPSPSRRSPSPAQIPNQDQADDTNTATKDQAATAEVELSTELELDGDILQLLGDAPKADASLGPPIHKDVASRWQEILAKGLSKDGKDKLLEEYAVPSNCDLLLAPALNPEAKAALSEPLVKRDSFLMQKQRQIGIALSALATATSLILSNETSKQKLLKPISDASRILCDNHFLESKSRRNLVISATNAQLKDTLLESVRDKNWLFGENISEKLKAAKSIQKSGDDLSKNQAKPAPRFNYHNKNNKGRLNYKTQHRKTDMKITTGSSDSGRSRTTARAPVRSTQQQRSTHRSPPRRRTHNK